MRDGRRQAWERALQRIGAWREGDDPEPVLEGLALLVVLDLAGDLEMLSAADRTVLRERGRRALLAGPPAHDAPDPEDWQHARDLARAGLSLVDGRPARAPADPLHPTDGALIRMLRGEPDGLTAAARAAHVRGCDACLGRLRVLRMADGEATVPSLAVAAATAAPMRAPTEGRVVARLADPEVEAVVFEDGAERYLAIYASASEPVRLVAEGVTTQQMLSGYWLGRVGPSTRRIGGALHVGDRTVTLEIELTAD